MLDLDVDPELGIPYIVQEFLGGITLEKRLDDAPEHRLPPSEALAVAVPVMGALIAAHRLGIVHRDLKPANIFLEQRSGRETPKVIDFGIAKFAANTPGSPGTRTGTMLGTPVYMSPEQAMGLVAEIGAQTDVWAMGVVLYEMLTGRIPYEAQTPEMILGMVQFQEPIALSARCVELSLSLPGDLVAAIDSAIVRDRTKRYPTMAAFLEALIETGAWTGTGNSPSRASSVPAPELPPPTPPAAEGPRPPSPMSIGEAWTTAGAGDTQRRKVKTVVGIVVGLVAVVCVAVVARSDGGNPTVPRAAAPMTAVTAPLPVAPTPLTVPSAPSVPEVTRDAGTITAPPIAARRIPTVPRNPAAGTTRTPSGVAIQRPPPSDRLPSSGLQPASNRTRW